MPPREGDVVVARAEAGPAVAAVVVVAAALRPAALAAAAAAALRPAALAAAAAQEHHALRVDLGHVALLSGLLVVPRARLDLALDVDLPALGEELADVLALLAPHDDVVPLGLVLAVAGGVRVGLSRGQRETAPRGPALRVAHLRILAEVAQEDHLVDAVSHAASPLARAAKQPRVGLEIVEPTPRAVNRRVAAPIQYRTVCAGVAGKRPMKKK